MISIRRKAQLHVALVIVLPALGTCAAMARAQQRGIHALQLGLFAAMYAVTLLGITVGYHRYFTHGAFKTSPFIARTLAIWGSMAGYGPLVYWAAIHRMHHRFEDSPGDPHSPYFHGERALGRLSGFFHAQLAWTWRHPVPDTLHYAKDLLKDARARGWSERYLYFFMLGFLVPAGIGGALGGVDGAIDGLLWGGMVRLCVTYHFGLATGSFAHLFGSRPFHMPRGHSANNLFIALINFGEGWHQNHHAFPTAASFGIGAAQLDLGALFIRTLAMLGLAWDVKTVSSASLDSKRMEPAS